MAASAITERLRVVILYESWHIFRSIPTDGRPHPKNLDPTWLGNSVAKWEGDTLVIDVADFNDKTTLDTVGHPHSDQMHLVERIRRTGPTTASYEVTVDDPKTYVRPFKVAFPLTQEPGYRNFEYACHEGNYAMFDSLSGARAQEKRAAEAAKKK